MPAAPAPGRCGTPHDQPEPVGVIRPKIARGNVPRPGQWSGCRWPASCNKAKAGCGPPPKMPITQAPTRWVMQASREETIGLKRLSRLASITRAPTWAGPIIMPANTARAGVAPKVSTIRGRCAAIAEVTLQAAAKANDSSTMVRSIGMWGFSTGPSVMGAASARGSERLSRKPDHEMRQCPGVAGFAPSERREAERTQRPGDRAGEARDQRNSGGVAPCIAAVDAPQCAEGGIVYANAEQQPRRRHHPERSRRAEQREAAGQNQTGNAQHLPARRRDRSAARRARPIIPRSQARLRTPRRTNCWKSRGRAQSDRPEWRADNSLIPMPASGPFRAPARRVANRSSSNWHPPKE